MIVDQNITNMRDLNILIVDDDPMILKTISKILKNSNQRYYIQTAETAEEAIGYIQKTYWDTILLDLSLPYKKGDSPDTQEGIRVLELLTVDLKVTAPIIAITGHYDHDLSDTVLDKGAYYFLNKPLRAKSLCAIVKNATGFKMSGFDGLTGLLNRHTFEERFKSEFERVKRKNEINKEKKNGDENLSYVSLIFFDGDNFKLINDSYSHLAGDQVLKKISSSFIDDELYKVQDGNNDFYKYIIRPYDIAARFGGDEFSIFLPETDHYSALIVAKRIRDQLKQYDLKEIVGADDKENLNLTITLSIGIATYPNPNFAKNHHDLLHLADEAMYVSKQNKIGEIYGYNKKGKIIKLD